MSEYQCKDCQHYLQHYSMGERKVIRVWCGHCTLPGFRRKRPDAPACQHFAPGTVGSPFVSKEYLSKALLDYMRSLELLPPIMDAE